MICTGGEFRTICPEVLKGNRVRAFDRCNTIQDTYLSVIDL